MRTLLLVPLIAMAGCGSYWDIRAGEDLPIGCANLLNYYLDVDGDGWGQAGAPTPLCEPDVAEGLTASNDLDCDDDDNQITGQVGSLCPEDLDPEGTSCYAGLLRGDSEFLVTCGSSPTQRYSIAESRCHAWSGQETEEGVPGHRGLAQLESEVEVFDVVAWLEDLPEVQPGFAVFVDLRWDGDLDSGSWRWPDGSSPDSIAPCGGSEPGVDDFYPALVPGDPNAEPTLEEHKDEVRLALVWDGTSWCRGTPDEGDAAIYDHQSAHYLCERPRPDLSQYEERPLGEDDADGPRGPGE